MRDARFSQVMKSGDALLAVWERTLARAADEAAIFDHRGDVLRTFGQIAAESVELQRDLLRGIEPRAVIAIQIGNHPSWPALFLACLRKSVIAVPLDAGTSEAAHHICNVVAAVRTRDGSIGIRAIEGARARTPLASDSVLLKLTSGTTATPRAVRFTSEQLLADCEQICDTMQIGHRDLNYGAISISHSYGFSNLLTPLIARGVPMILSSDRLPRAILDGLVATEASVFPGMPLLYQALCEIEEPPPLPALRLCISAGAPLPLSVAREFRAKYQHAIHSFYGSSECGGICYDREALLLDQGFVGDAMDGVRIQMEDESGDSSRVRVSSAAVASGYFPDEQPDKLGNGVFIPDDLLRKTDRGFQIVGRASDLINVAGRKVNPAEVEMHLLRCSGVREAVVFARPSQFRNEEVAACVVADRALTEAALIEQCRSALSSWQVPKRIFFLASLPVNERGKLSRRALAERFAQQA